MEPTGAWPDAHPPQLGAAQRGPRQRSGQKEQRPDGRSPMEPTGMVPDARQPGLGMRTAHHGAVRGSALAGGLQTKQNKGNRQTPAP